MYKRQPSPSRKQAKDVSAGKANPPHHRQHQRPSILIGGKLWTIHQAHIIQMSARARSRKRIADASGITLNTLKTEINFIYKQLGIHSKEELMRWALLNGADQLNLPPDL